MKKILTFILLVICISASFGQQDNAAPGSYVNPTTSLKPAIGLNQILISRPVLDTYYRFDYKPLLFDISNDSLRLTDDIGIDLSEFSKSIYSDDGNILNNRLVTIENNSQFKITATTDYGGGAGATTSLSLTGDGYTISNNDSFGKEGAISIANGGVNLRSSAAVSFSQSYINLNPADSSITVNAFKNLEIGIDGNFGTIGNSLLSDGDGGVTWGAGTNIYSSNGSLGGNRTIDHDGFSFFQNNVKDKSETTGLINGQFAAIRLGDRGANPIDAENGFSLEVIDNIIGQHLMAGISGDPSSLVFTSGRTNNQNITNKLIFNTKAARAVSGTPNKGLYLTMIGAGGETEFVQSTVIDTANNGLTLNSPTIKLGGSLLENTTIQDTFELIRAGDFRIKNTVPDLQAIGGGGSGFFTVSGQPTQIRLFLFDPFIGAQVGKKIHLQDIYNSVVVEGDYLITSVTSASDFYIEYGSPFSSSEPNAGANAYIADDVVNTQFTAEGDVRFSSFGGGGKSGTLAYVLAVDSSGNVIEVESDGGGGGGGIGTDDQTAAEVPFSPAGSLVATDVQAALEELDAMTTGAGDTLDIIQLADRSVKLQMEPTGSRMITPHGPFSFLDFANDTYSSSQIFSPSLKSVTIQSHDDHSFLFNTGGDFSIQAQTINSNLKLEVLRPSSPFFPTTKLEIGDSIVIIGDLKLDEYGKGNISGEVAKYLGVDTLGNVIEINPVSFQKAFVIADFVANELKINQSEHGLSHAPNDVYHITVTDDNGNIFFIPSTTDLTDGEVKITTSTPFDGFVRISR